MRYYITKHDPLKKRKFDLHLVFIQSHMRYYITKHDRNFDLHLVFIPSHMIYYITKHDQLKKLGQIKITASHMVSNFELALS